MSDTIEREVARLLHASVAEQPPDNPFLAASAMSRASRIRKVRYVASAAVVAALVTAAVAIPSALLRHEAAPLPPPTTTDVRAWPVRGDLAHNKPLIKRARATWAAALRAADRGGLTEPVQALYAGRVPGIGVTVALTGVEPRGGKRVVVVTGPDEQHLSLYADAGGNVGDLLVVGFSPLPQNGEPCSTQTAPITTLVVAPPSATRAVWQPQPPLGPGCYDRRPDPRHEIALVHGSTITTIEYPYNGYVTFGLAAKQAVASAQITNREPVQRLTGGRVAPGAPREHSPSSSTTTSSGNSLTASGSVRVGPGPGGNPLGWAQRYDASGYSGITDIYSLLGQRHETGGGASEVPIVGMALPDGTPFALQVATLHAGGEYAELGIPLGLGRTAVYFDRRIDGAPAPKQFSAIVKTATGRLYLIVMGQPGVATIEYRPAGKAQWQSLDVYLSTAYIRVAGTGSANDKIRLRDSSGRTVYEGAIGARAPVGIASRDFDR